MSVDEEHRDQVLQKAIAGYQVAVDLAGSYRTSAWAVSGVMLVAHSVIMTRLIGATSAEHGLSVVDWLSPALGLFLCAAWAVIVERNYRFVVLYTLSARTLEERYLTPIVNTLSDGARLSHHDPVPFAFTGYAESKELRTRGVLQRPRAFWFVRLTILAFAATYVAALVSMVLDC